MTNQKTPLFSQDQYIQLDINLYKLPTKPEIKQHVIPLQIPLNDKNSTEICIFVRDSKSAKLILEQKNVPNIKKVIDIKKLKTNYDRYEARRLLASSYDLYLCEANVIVYALRYLGSSFIKRRRFE